MAIAVHPRGEVRILEIEAGSAPGGENAALPLDLRGHSLTGLGRTVRQLLDEGCRQVVLDLARVADLDSAGLGELVACRKRALQYGGDLLLLHPAGKVRERLQMLHLTRVFEVFDDEAAALAWFNRKETTSH